MIEIAINSHVYNKTNNYYTYNSKFENKLLSPKELLDHILLGHSFCISKLKSNNSKYSKRISENFVQGQLIAIDIDNKKGDKKLTKTEGYVTFEVVSKEPFFNEYGSFIYTTPSHSEDHHRFRIVFVLDKPIANRKEFKSYLITLTKKYSGDVATTSIVQGFFGSSSAKFKFIGNTLTKDIVSNVFPKNNSTFEALLKNEKIELYDYEDFSTQDYIDILQSIFRNGKIDNDIWWRIPSILKSYCKLPESKIIKLISATIGEVGDTKTKLKYSEKYIGNMHLGHLVKLAQLNGYVLLNKKYNKSNIFKFWTIQKNDHHNSKSKFSIDLKYTLFEDFLIKNGFMVYRNEKSNTLVRINELSHISILQESELREFVFTTLRRNGFLFLNSNEKQLVNEKLRRQSDRIFGTTIRNLPVINKKLQRDLLLDTSEIIYLKLKNGLIEIKEDNCSILDYSRINKLIWKDSIIDLEFKDADSKMSEFETFVRCVCKTKDHNNKQNFNQNKFNVLKSVLGYLISNNKKKSETYAIILTDEEITDSIEGGTGKSIFLEAISKVRSVKEIDGQTLDLNSNFAFSDIESHHEVINIDDCDSKFNFKKLFHSITGDLQVEKKNQNKITIPFNNSPKFCLSTNHVFKGQGNSFERRKIEIEFSNYFNSNHTPIDEFNHQLYYDWNNEEWNRFLNFMIHCCQYYLKHGVVKYNQTNLKKKRLHETIGKELADFFDKYIEVEKLFIKNELFDEFNRLNRSQISLRTFKIGLAYWAESYNNYTLIDKLQRKYKLYATVVTKNKKLNIKSLINDDTVDQFEKYNK